jgi:RNA polymerase sigma-70 factor, ECF subfamily
LASKVGSFLASAEAAKFHTYLYRVVTRLCVDWEAKKRPEYRDTLPPTTDSSRGPEALFGQNELGDAVRKCLGKLPINQRVAITLRHYDGMSYGEISEVLGVSAKAVDSLLQRARDTLRQCLRPFE